MKPKPLSTYLWQQPGWPDFSWDSALVAQANEQALQAWAQLLAQLAAVGFNNQEKLTQDTWVEEALATAAIEGENLDLAQVRSSVQHKLGLTDLAQVEHRIEGLVEVLQEAMQPTAHLAKADLCRWHALLFPYELAFNGGIRKLTIGHYRTHADAMQIVSGLPGREVVHYTAPPSAQVPAEMEKFLAWFNSPDKADGLTRAAIAHLWFELIHPFEDGNGRLGRAIAERALAQALNEPLRWCSLSRQLFHEKKAYYANLQAASQGSLDITPWITWFLQMFQAACQHSQSLVHATLEKNRYWADYAHCHINERQRKVLHKLLAAGNGGFLGGLTAEKYIKLTGTSKATATRDLSDLVQKNMLRVQGVGKATRYGVNITGWE